MNSQRFSTTAFTLFLQIILLFLTSCLPEKEPKKETVIRSLADYEEFLRHDIKIIDYGMIWFPQHLHRIARDSVQEYRFQIKSDLEDAETYYKVSDNGRSSLIPKEGILITNQIRRLYVESAASGFSFTREVEFDFRSFTKDELEKINIQFTQEENQLILLGSSKDIQISHILYEYQLIDISGRVVKSDKGIIQGFIHEYDSRTVISDLSEVENGVYFIDLNFGGQRVRSKIIVP